MGEPRVFWEITPTRTITKYFDDGLIELWLSNDDNDELYLIKSYQSPTGKSPIVEMKTYSDEITTAQPTNLRMEKNDV